MDVHTCYRDLDDIEDWGKRLELALRGVFAGNVFDLGAQGTADMFENGEVHNRKEPDKDIHLHQFDN